MKQLALVWDRVNPKDQERAGKLTNDLRRILDIMMDRKPHLVRDMAKDLDLPECSVSAQLRHLRKPKFGRFNIVRKSLTKGVSYYILQEGQYEG